jgi:predicted DNA-binding transcriptional regulator YafY
VASPFLDELRASVWNDESIEIVYQRGDGTLANYEVQPYALVVKVDTWYLIGLRRKPGQAKPEMRVYRLSRLQSLQRTARPFVRDPDFDLHKFWHGWCERFEKNPPNNYSVELLISARGRKQLLSTYGSWFRQRLEVLDDKPGRKPVILDFDREEAALRVLFQLGDDVEIVKPKALRRKLNALATRVVAATG